MYADVLNATRQSGTWATARAKVHLNDAQEDVWREAKEFTQLEKTATASAVKGQANYSLPTDFIRVKEMEITTTGGDTRTEIRDAGWTSVNKALADNGNDVPTAYTIHYQQLWFNRTFSTTDTIRMTYFYSPADLSADGNTTPLPERLLTQYAIAMLHRDLGRMDSYQSEMQHYYEIKEQYLTGDGRSDDRLDGFLHGSDGIWGYWDKDRMYG